MAKLGYCSINNLKLSRRSIEAVKDIKHIAEQSNYLIAALGSVPMLDIFLDRANPAEKILSIGAYDWMEFSRVFQGAGKVTKEKIRQVATMEAMYSHGEEGEFWRCVADAAL